MQENHPEHRKSPAGTAGNSASVFCMCGATASAPPEQHGSRPSHAVYREKACPFKEPLII